MLVGRYGKRLFIGNPGLGQCSVAAVLAQDRLGGETLKTKVGNAWHFYNLMNGERLDFTASQFDVAIAHDDNASGREDTFTDTTPAQYAALSAAFRTLSPEDE